MASSLASFGGNRRGTFTGYRHTRRLNGTEGSSLSIVVNDGDRYLALVKQFPLRPIRDQGHYRAAIEILDRLFELGTERSVEEEDYFSVLALLAWDYENSACNGQVEC
jgi:hypothetical protein